MSAQDIKAHQGALEQTRVPPVDISSSPAHPVPLPPAPLQLCLELITCDLDDSSTPIRHQDVQ